ncbi:hypothetical protein [Helicobacter typhlonius]|uniref:DUF177 domain-containing protein n=1 Tax=Helicobacter typhlonius TaxID=76936 RepID=A0A099UCY3_9HELI|nr:hypothetical protein [Helicobacter typhlonius]TLD78233.1 hypothetical protein LS75_007220 [Helicobacter typhlonius]TLD86885.1 hypothetical protein LS67_007550 [Helicobacter sp. MIT 03-1616]CUU40718.1 FIG00712321: Hypothetical protein [Helicobacter typhlonius]
MKIAMRKFSHTPKDIELTLNSEGELVAEHITLKGHIKRVDSKILYLDAKVFGEIELICDSSGETYVKEIDYPLVLYISDGIWDSQSQSKSFDSFEVIEFFDGFVDLHYILESEMTSLRSDYHTKDN